jgi:hypothetical protein
MAARMVRLVSRGSDGSLRTRDFAAFAELLEGWEQIGIDDCSTDLDLRGSPVFRGLVGPIPDGKAVARYETPEVFEILTKEWANTRIKRRRRRMEKPAGATDLPSAVDATVPKPRVMPIIPASHFSWVSVNMTMHNS